MITFIIAIFILSFAQPLLAQTPQKVELDFGDISDEIQENEENINRAERDITNLRQVYLDFQEETYEQRILRKKEEVKTLYSGNSYEKAAIIAYELVSDPPKSRDSSSPKPLISDSNSSEYFEFEKLLAESLYAQKNYYAANEYFKDLFLRGGGSYKDSSLLRLAQIAELTENYSDLDLYYQQMSRAGGATFSSEARYLFGKSFFKKGDTARAKEQLLAIKAGEPFYVRARYFYGAILVTENKLDEAVTVFKNIISVPPTNEEQTKVVDLAKLALGRIEFARGNFDAAKAIYQTVDKSSNYYNETLYEISWTLIKKNQLDAALNFIDLYIISLEDELEIPHARIVQARLLLKSGDFEKAETEMKAIIKEYDGAQEEIERIVSLYKDPEVYYYELTGIQPESTAEGSAPTGEKLPDVAKKWATQDPKMNTALEISKDLQSVQSSTERAVKYSSGISKKLSSKNAIELFSETKEGRAESLTIENSLLNAEKQLSELKTKIISAYVPQSDRAKLEKLRKEREDLEKAVAKMPKTEKQYFEQMEAINKQIDGIEAILALSRSRIVVLKNVLNAIEKNYSENKSKIVREEQAEKLYLAELQKEKEVLNMFEEQLKAIETDVDGLKDEIGIGEVAASSTEVRNAYLKAINDERKMAEQVKTALPSEANAFVTQIDANLQKIAHVRSDVVSFNESLEQKIASKSSSLKDKIEGERTNMQVYLSALENLQKECKQVAGGIAMTTLGNVRNKFYDILLEANIGLVNITWRQKELITKSKDKLIEDKTRLLDELKREFNEAREEQQ